MYKDKFDELVELGVISELEKEKTYKQMSPNKKGQLTGQVDSMIDFKYYVGGDIFNDNLCDFVKKYCSPHQGMEFIDDTFKTYGYTGAGYFDGWWWREKDSITQWAIEQGHKPIEEATNEELWKMLAMTSMYWEGSYKEWYKKAEEKNKRV